MTRFMYSRQRLAQMGRRGLVHLRAHEFFGWPVIASRKLLIDGKHLARDIGQEHGIRPVASRGAGGLLTFLERQFGLPALGDVFDGPLQLQQLALCVLDRPHMQGASEQAPVLAAVQILKTLRIRLLHDLARDLCSALRIGKESVATFLTVEATSSGDS